MKNDQKIIYTYTLSDLEKMSYLDLYHKLSIKELYNLKYLPDNFIINVNYINSFSLDYIFSEQEAYEEIYNILQYLDLYNKNITVKIDIKHRFIFESSKLYNITLKSVKLLLSYDFDDYSLNEYQLQSEKLNQMIMKINNEKLTPFEKYISIYDYVKNYKKYKENPDDNIKSRSLKYIIDNEYIVCYGYVSLMIALLDKVGINSTFYFLNYYDDNLEKYYHTRLLVYLNDDQYNIHGYFIADPTWDSNNDYYNYALMSFNDLQKEGRFSSLCDVDLIFDVSSMEEYNQKINYYLDKNDNDYLKLYKFILLQLQYLDLDSFNYLFHCYNFLNGNYDKNKMNEFLTEFGYYVLRRTNTNISSLKVLLAVINSKTKINNKAYIDMDLVKRNIIRDKEAFPYEITNNIHQVRLRDEIN